MIQNFLSSDMAWRLGWTLLHSVWQVGVISVVVGLALALTARRSANLRYAIACVGMAAMFAPLLATLVMVEPRPIEAAQFQLPRPAQVAYVTDGTAPAQQRLQSLQLPATAPADVAAQPKTHKSIRSAEPAVSSWSMLRLSEVVSPWLPWVVAAWFVGVLLLGVWNIGGWLLIQRIKNLATTPAAQHAQRRLAEFTRRLQMSRPVRLVESLLIETPTVIGWLRPVILLPASLTTTLTAAELDAILAHELIHIRRHDYLVNLLQAVTETLLFYHPCVWWLSRRIRIEREFCCDDAAVALCGAKSGYVSALAAIERGRVAPVPALAFASKSTNMTLLRIRRLLGGSPGAVRPWPTGMSAALLPLVVVTLVGTALTQSGRLAASDEDPVQQRVQQQKLIKPQPANPATSKPQADENVDLKEFRLILTYHGEADKPFYNVTLSRPPVSHQQSDFSTLVMIDEKQAKTIFEQLSASGFYKRAKVTDNQNDPTTGPQYLLRVRTGDKHYEESLGWDIGTITRLDGIRKALDGDAAKAMDRLLDRLAGQRKVWQEGQVVNDLKTTLSAEAKSFPAGRPIPIKLEISNVGDANREYGQHSVSRSEHEMVIIDELGRRVPFVAGPSQLPERPMTIGHGETNLIEAFDLAEFYYLRRPGRYTVAYRSPTKRSSNALSIEITPDAAGVADGDPIGRLLQLVHGTWVLQGSPSATGRVNPGSNYTDVPGRSVLFLDNPTGYKKDVALIWVWLTDEPANPYKPAAETFVPASEYLGVAGRWHLYVHASDEALKRWPSVKEVLKKALNTELGTAEPSPPESRTTDDDYRTLHDRYRALVLKPAHAENEQQLIESTDQFNTAIGGKLVYVQVVRRTGPIAEHQTVLSKFFGDRKISPGKIHLAASTKPHVAQNANGEGHVLIATSPLENQEWPYDLQITLLMEPVTRSEIDRTSTEPKWGETRQGLHTRLVAQKRVFDAGESIPLKLQLKNTTDQPKEYRIPPGPIDERLSVVDRRGKPAFPLGGFAQITVGPYRTITLEPGQTIELESFDLADLYYLREPGRYTVLFTGEPASAPFEFDVAVNPALAVADGDPVGRLLPLVKKGWWLGAGPGKPAKFQPGSNHRETIGRGMTFVFNGPKWKDDAGLINLWLAEKAAPEQPVSPESSLPQTEYLGKLSRWHVYYLASEKALAAWPTAKEEIKQALSAESKVALQIDVKRDAFAFGEDIQFALTIHNAGSLKLDAPSTYWSASLILDGKEHKRLPEFIGTWNGQGEIVPGGDYASAGTELSEYGIKPGSLKPSQHSLAVQIADVKSNEVTFTVAEQAASGATDSIRVVLQAETLQYTLEGQKSKPVQHRPRPYANSPDGIWTIRENEAGVVRRLTVEPVGGGQGRPLPGPDGNEFSYSWSPDSKRIAYVAWEGKKGQVHVIDVDGSNDQQITDSEFGASGPSFGPDGSLAYVVWRGGIGKGRHSDLVIRRDKETKTILTDQYIGGFTWSPDGKTLAISKMAELTFYDLDEKSDPKSIKLTDIDPGMGSHMAHHVTWSPEGDRVACCVYFVGGRTRGPRMAGDDEVFIIPRDGKPHSFSIKPTGPDDEASKDEFPLTVHGLEWVRS